MTTASTTPIIEIIASTGAICDGHFELSSGRHATTYVQGAQLTRQPSNALQLGAMLAHRMAQYEPDAIVAPAIGALTIGFATAAALDVPFLFAERDASGHMCLRRGFSVDAGMRVAIIEDVVTTGGSAAEVAALVEAYGAQPVAVGCIVQRRDPQHELITQLAHLRVEALHVLEAPSWPAGQCPACSTAERLVKPGSRRSPNTVDCS